MICRLQFFIFLSWLLAGHSTAVRAEPLESPFPAASSFLLVASQQMPDPRFRKTVLLVSRHGHTGPIGVIINRPQKTTLNKIFPDYPAAKAFNLFYGGPAYTRQISYLVRGTNAIAGALTVSADIYLAYDVAILGELLNGKRHHTGLRVMHGLASWAPGQLEREIKQGDWFMMPLNEALLFDHPPEELWQELQGHAAVL